MHDITILSYYIGLLPRENDILHVKNPTSNYLGIKLVTPPFDESLIRHKGVEGGEQGC